MLYTLFDKASRYTKFHSLFVPVRLIKSLNLLLHRSQKQSCSKETITVLLRLILAVTSRMHHSKNNAVLN